MHRESVSDPTTEIVRLDLGHYDPRHPPQTSVSGTSPSRPTRSLPVGDPLGGQRPTDKRRKGRLR